MINRFEHVPRLSKIIRGMAQSGGTAKGGKPFFPGEAAHFHYCGSGKAAIAAVLSFLRQTGTLKNKMAPVLVPGWVGFSVYQTIIEQGFPVLADNPDVKVLIAYHQYGFPQDMDRIMDYAASNKKIVIEDCAHACDSQYKGRRLGTIGDFGIYSFSKFCFCFALGGVSFKDNDFKYFFDQRASKGSGSLVAGINLVKLIASLNTVRRRPIFPEFVGGLTKMAYARYGDCAPPWGRAISMFENQIDSVVYKKQAIYRYIRERLDRFGVCDHLESHGVTPYAVPLMIKPNNATPIIQRLQEKQFETGYYSFDVNRFVVEPNFQKVVLIPCHSAMTDATVDVMLDTIRDFL